MSDLSQKKCVPCEGGVKPLDRAMCDTLIKQLGSQWKLTADGKQITATFEFKNYFRTTAFVNAVAWIAHNEDHHPDIAISYRRVTLTYSTHSAGGLTEKDFAGAAAADALLGAFGAR